MSTNQPLNNTNHKVIAGDSRQMTDLKDESVQLIVTSPPYWQLKDYGNDQQIGFDQTYEEYINDLNLVWQECYRVLPSGCRLCINIGDQFARSTYYGRYKIVPIRMEIIRCCEALGFDYMGAIIWQKATTMNTSGGASVMGSYPYPRNGIIKLDYEFILLFKKPGSFPQVDTETKKASALTHEEWTSWFTGHWNFAGERQKEHIAAFPEELPKRLIKMFSFVGELVLDPFLGSGTTTEAARNNGRNSVGYEINSDFINVIQRRVQSPPLLKEDNNEVSFINSKQGAFDRETQLAKLPYIFRDPIKINKQIDPRKKTYGSRISVNEINLKRAVG